MFSRRLLFATAVLLAGCRERPQAAAPGVEQVSGPGLTARDQLLLAAAKVALPPAGIAPADLPDPRSRGAVILATYCAQCHELPAPAMHGATDWPGVTRRMWLRMELLPQGMGVRVPRMDERHVLLEYLTANALKVSGAALPPGRGREEFALVCSQCHALPDPRIHSAVDWPVVFVRMERNMERMNVPPPAGAGEVGEILLYLQMVAARR